MFTSARSTGLALRAEVALRVSAFLGGVTQSEGIHTLTITASGTERAACDDHIITMHGLTVE